MSIVEGQLLTTRQGRNLVVDQDAFLPLSGKLVSVLRTRKHVGEL